jgi:hypothetical protein
MFAPALLWWGEKTAVRVVDQRDQSISFRLNIIGVRVYRDYCQLSAKSGSEWHAVGPPRSLPLTIPNDPAEIGSDPLLLTTYQYEHEQPGSELYDVLAKRKDFDRALKEGEAHSGATAR